MANEARVTTSLTIRKVSGTIVLLDERHSDSFAVDVDGAAGPTPGLVSISTSGTDVDFSRLTYPGLVRFKSLDATNYVDVGAYEPATGVFYPLFEVGPGESYVHKLSRNLGEQWGGTVTGTGTDAENNTIRMRANGAAVNMYVGAFER